MEKKTPLYQTHVDMGGKIVPFAGYLMPVQYKTGVIAEHQAVRTKAGLFDVSHMGEVFVKGAGALAFLQMLLTNNMDGMEDGDCRYSPMANKEGGTVDDLIACRLSAEEYLLVVNASNREKDFAWMEAQLFGDVQLTDESDNWGELALQGPKALEILGKLTTEYPEKNYTFRNQVKVGDVTCLVSRTGYTGEDGFELYCASTDVVVLWETLLAAGSSEGLIPCGLGARDTLRLEAGMPLYGHELAEDISLQEANLGYFIKMDKPGFIGKLALAAGTPPKRRRSGLKITGRGIARDGDKVYSGDEEVGLVSSGTMLPSVGYAGAMAFLRLDQREIGTALQVDVRGRRVEAEVIKLPFYKRTT